MPVLLVLVLLPMQFALWWHAKQAADLAAEEAVEAAQVVEAADVGEQARAGALAVLSEAGNLTDVTVSASTTSSSVIVEVRGTLNYSIIGTFTVTARAEGPLERFVPANQR
jgi:Flp pilus assembly protein TadG